MFKFTSNENIQILLYTQIKQYNSLNKDFLILKVLHNFIHVQLNYLSKFKNTFINILHNWPVQINNSFRHIQFIYSFKNMKYIFHKNILAENQNRIFCHSSVHRKCGRFHSKISQKPYRVKSNFDTNSTHPFKI